MKNLFSILLLIIPILTYADDTNFETDKGTITKSDIPNDAPKFEDYLTKDIFQGVPAIPKINTSSEFRYMRTSIKEAAKTGPNFAGHYTLIFTGCGSGAVCLTAIADAKTGNLYQSNLLGSIENFNIASDVEEISYRKDSNLLRVA